MALLNENSKSPGGAYTRAWRQRRAALVPVETKFNNRYLHISDDDLVNRARVFRSRTDWKNHRNGEYLHTMHCRRYLLRRCTEHMSPPIDPHGRVYSVYMYQFPDATYVGLTLNPSVRHLKHRKTGPVAEAILRHQGQFVFVTLVESIARDEAIKLEKATIKDLHKSGVTLLNRSAGGELGSIVFKWTYEAVLEVAKQYHRRSDFRRHEKKAGLAAQKRGWINKLASALGWPPPQAGKWTEKTCYEEAHKYRTGLEWRRNSPGSWKRAKQSGWYVSIRARLRWSI